MQLTCIHFHNCQYLERFEGLEFLVKPGTPFLYVCSSLGLEFPSLVNFPSLKDLRLLGAAKLKKMSGFASLRALHTLELTGSKELQELPGIEDCTRTILYLDLSVMDFCDEGSGKHHSFKN